MFSTEVKTFIANLSDLVSKKKSKHFGASLTLWVNDAGAHHGSTQQLTSKKNTFLLPNYLTIETGQMKKVAVFETEFRG